jgi:hypothetical protein
MIISTALLVGQILFVTLMLSLEIIFGDQKTTTRLLETLRWLVMILMGLWIYSRVLKGAYDLSVTKIEQCHLDEPRILWIKG